MPMPVTPMSGANYPANPSASAEIEAVQQIQKSAHPMANPTDGPMPAVKKLYVPPARGMAAPISA